MNSDELLDNFKSKVNRLTVDAFRGMGTNLTSGLTKIHEVFLHDGMTQFDRDNLGISSNKVVEHI